MSDDITTKVIEALAWLRKGWDGDNSERAITAFETLDTAGVFAAVDAASDAAKVPVTVGRHRRRVLGSGVATVPPVPDYSPSVGETNPEPESGVPTAVRFDVDLVYKYRQADGEWTPSRTHQETLFATDQEDALRIAGDRLLNTLRRAGYVKEAHCLQVTGGTTRAGA